MVKDIVHRRISSSQNIWWLFLARSKRTVKHFTSSIALLIFERRKNNQTSFLEEYFKLIDEVTKNQLDCLEKYGAIYINKLGGYCFGIHDFDDICIKEELYFPSDDNKPKIKIKKWPGGSHYYAYINGREVKDEFGNIKWNTEKKANEVVLEYLNKNGWYRRKKHISTVREI